MAKAQPKIRRSLSRQPVERPKLVCGEGLTEQHHKETVDIHNIVKKYEKTGMVTHLAKYEGSYMDLINAPDFQEAQNAIAEAKSTFETVPSKIRELFHNDPVEFVDFMQNPENREQMLELGFTDAHLPPLESDSPDPTPTPPKPKNAPEPAPEPSGDD